jgi:acetyltransferase
MKEVPDRLLREFTRPGQREHFGIVAEADGRSAEGGPLLVAEARYIRYPGSDAAEFALVVADGWRRAGLGSLLMQTLLRQASLAGVQRLCGDAFTDNEAIRRLMRAHGARPMLRSESTATVRLCVGTRHDRQS